MYVFGQVTIRSLNILVIVGHRYLTPLVTSYPILIPWRLLVCEGSKEITEEKKKERERRYLFNFNFFH